MTDTEGFGALAAALSKAQAAFPPIQRDKEVTVTMKSGGSYKFKYAPLDTIFAAVRKPLSDNGLAIVQLLDDGELVTMLLHSDGARLAGRIALPGGESQTVQELGSAITYLRRYSLQAILGIATEEDDDGNHAAGNATTPRSRAKAQDEPQEPYPLVLTGRVAIGKAPSDGEYHVGKDGHAWGFVIEEGTKRMQVLMEAPLGEALFNAFEAEALRKELVGQTVTVHGMVMQIDWTNNKGVKLTYPRLVGDRIETPGWTMPKPQPVETDIIDGSGLTPVHPDKELNPPRAVCGVVSTYGDGATCNLEAKHRNAHRGGNPITGELETWT